MDILKYGEFNVTKIWKKTQTRKEMQKLKIFFKDNNIKLRKVTSK